MKKKWSEKTKDEKIQHAIFEGKEVVVKYLYLLMVLQVEIDAWSNYDNLKGELKDLEGALSVVEHYLHFLERRYSLKTGE